MQRDLPPLLESSIPGSWDPAIYDNFKNERRQPFYDLLSLLHPCPGARVIDLGCGNGELTLELHNYLKAAETVGIDQSSEMLGPTKQLGFAGLHFVHQTIESVLSGWSGNKNALPETSGKFDVIFSNAALQWLANHREIFRAIASGLVPEGQLCIQVPASYDHPSHSAVDDIMYEEPFATYFQDSTVVPARVDWVLAPEEYSQILFDEGFSKFHVRLQVYGRQLGSTRDLTNWMEGSLLSPFRAIFPPDIFTQFLHRYTQRVLEIEGDHSPYFFAFKRILMWGVK